MNARVAMFGMTCFLMCSFIFSAEAKAENSQVVSLKIEGEEMVAGEEVWLQMTVKNRGKTPVRIVRPRADGITRIGEFGWVARVEGSQGIYGTLPEPREIMAVTDADLIELAPGEFVGTRFRIGHYVLLSKQDRPLQSVHMTPGTYSLQVFYHAEQRGPFLLENHKRAELFLGPLSSNKIEFEID